MAISALSLTIPEGSCVGIVGPTGAGKTTLLHCLAGILGKHHPGIVLSGRLQIGDVAYEGFPRDILFPTVGLVLQDPFVQISGVRDKVYEELLFTIENTGRGGEGSDFLIQSVLRNLGIEHLANRKPTTLSGGETQRVALASILIAEPSVLLLDEPITALDATAQAKLRAILKGLHGKTTVLLTDTQIDFPLSVCDEIVILDQGKMIVAGKPRQLLSDGHDLANVGGWKRWGRITARLKDLSHEASREAPRILKALGLR